MDDLLYAGPARVWRGPMESDFATIPYRAKFGKKFSKSIAN